jgi:hypothetical protein
MSVQVANVEELIALLAEKGVQLWADGDRLRVPRGVLNAELPYLTTVFLSWKRRQRPESEENRVFPMGRKTSHTSRRTSLTLAAIEATLPSRSGKHELELANFNTLSAILSSRYGLASTAAKPMLTRRSFGSRTIRFARSSLSARNVLCARLSPTRRKQP